MSYLMHDGLSSKWVIFHELDVPSRKTKVFEVRNKESDDFLGTIEFKGAWRQYIFSPGAERIFNNKCLNDITRFITSLTEEWKKSVCEEGKNDDRTD